MKDYGIVESAVKPEPIKIDEYSVWVSTEIVPFEREIEGEIFTGYSYRLVQYGKDEYLKIQIAENAALAEQITDTQLALCEMFENMGV